MTTKHTPGPWFVTGHMTRYVEAHISGGLIQEVASCGPTQADGGYGQQQHANARLIAAAPALLEALSEILDGYLYGCDMKTKRENIKKAHAAIALATLDTNEQGGL